MIFYTAEQFGLKIDKSLVSRTLSRGQSTIDDKVGKRSLIDEIFHIENQKLRIEKTNSISYEQTMVAMRLNFSYWFEL